jgi:hypothetical protein
MTFSPNKSSFILAGNPCIFNHIFLVTLLYFLGYVFYRKDMFFVSRLSSPAQVPSKQNMDLRWGK